MTLKLKFHTPILVNIPNDILLVIQNIYLKIEFIIAIFLIIHFIFQMKLMDYILSLHEIYQILFCIKLKIESILL